MKLIAFGYSVKIWITSVLIAPVSFLLMGFTQNPIKVNDLAGLIPMYIFLVVFQLVFSLLTWLMFWMIIELIAGIFERTGLRKFLISIIGVGLTVATFCIFPFFEDGDLRGGLLLLLLSNCGCISIGSWYFKLPQRVTISQVQIHSAPHPDSNNSFSDAPGN